MLVALIIIVYALIVTYCILLVRDIMGKSTPKEVLRYTYKTYTILLYRRAVTYELIVKSHVCCSMILHIPDIPVWDPRHALHLVAALGILDTPALMELSKMFESQKISIF